MTTEVTVQTSRKMVINFDISLDAIEMMKEKFMPLTVKDSTDKESYKAVVEARKTVRDHRLSVEERRKELKAESLEFGRRVDTEAKKLSTLLEAIESHLDQEKKKVDEEIERLKFEKAQKAKLELRKQRLQLAGLELSEAELLSLDDIAFEIKLSDFNNEKIKKALAEQETRTAAIRLEQEKKELEAKLALEQESKRIKAEQNKLDQERKAFAEQQQAEKKRLEDAELAKQAALVQEALKKKELLDAEARKPDQEKLKDFALKIESISFPDLTTEWGKAKLQLATQGLSDLIKFLRD